MSPLLAEAERVSLQLELSVLLKYPFECKRLVGAHDEARADRTPHTATGPLTPLPARLHAAVHVERRRALEQV